MAKQVFESHSLTEYIYSFSNQGYDEHQEKLTQVFAEMFQEPYEDVLAEFYHSYYDRSMRHDEPFHIATFLQETYDDEELRLLLLSTRWSRCMSERYQQLNRILYEIV